MTPTTSHLPGWQTLQPSVQKPRFFQAFRRFGPLSRPLGVDLGTSKTAIYAPEQGIVLQEPSLVALEKSTWTPIAFGAEAQNFAGRYPDRIAVVQPIKYGQVEELELTEMMLRHFLSQVPGRNGLFRPRVSIACDSNAVGVSCLVLQDLLFASGARRTALVDRSMAAALGAGLRLDDPSGRLIVDIGAATTEVAVVSRMGTLIRESIRVGGVHIDRAIHHFLRTNHQVLVSEATAEQIKIKYGCVCGETPSGAVAQGLDLISNQPTRVAIAPVALQQVIVPIVMPIVDAIRYVLGQIAPTLVLDIAEHGMVLTGGGALLTGLDEFLGQALNLKTQVAPDPINGIALGLGHTIDHTVPNSEVVPA